MSPDKRGRCQQLQGRPHTPPPAGPGWPGGQRLSRNGGRGGPRGASAVSSTPAVPSTPRLAFPAAPFPGEGKPRTGLWRDAARGLCGGARSCLLVLSSLGWARPGLRGCGAAGPGLGCSSCRSAGVWAAAASAGMCLSPSSLKCGASHSLTPASLRRRAAAAAGALPFLVAHSLTRPPCSLLLLRVRALRPRPSWQGAPTTAAPQVLLLPAPAPAAATSVSLA